MLQPAIPILHGKITTTEFQLSQFAPSKPKRAVYLLTMPPLIQCFSTDTCRNQTPLPPLQQTFSYFSYFTYYSYLKQGYLQLHPYFSHPIRLLTLKILYISSFTEETPLSDLSLLTRGPSNGTNSLRIPPTSTMFLKKETSPTFHRTRPPGESLAIISAEILIRKFLNFAPPVLDGTLQNRLLLSAPRVKVSAKSSETTTNNNFTDFHRRRV